MTLFILGFVCGVLFSIAWVFVEFGLECAKLAGRKWSWKHGFSKHASYLELERLNAEPDHKAPPW